VDLSGVDLRAPEHRRETFLRSWEFTLTYGTHPGCVYLAWPALARHLSWGPGEALWYAFINGNTQHPATSLVLWCAAPLPRHADLLVNAWRSLYGSLAFDTDRRYHRKALDAAVLSYLGLVGGGSQEAFWRARAGEGWASCWAAARSVATFGRLSAWSYLEYVRLCGIPLDAADLMLTDRDGSRSHRNGLAIVEGSDDLDWHPSNPAYRGFTAADLERLAALGEDLLTTMRLRAAGQPWLGDVTRLTLESALCTYKGWHRPNRRYPNVYADMMYDRLVAAEAAHPTVDFTPLWLAREERLPARLRLEASPHDPGLGRLKQNFYRLHGRQHTLGLRWPDMLSDLDGHLADGSLGTFRPVRDMGRSAHLA